MTHQIAVLHFYSMTPIGDVEVAMYKVPRQLYFLDEMARFKREGGVWNHETQNFFLWHSISRIENKTEEI
jgi:hypothetical protein